MGMPKTFIDLFAGIGGIELGLERAGHETELLCEIDPYAREVLRTQFPGRKVHDDVRTLDTLPDVDLLSAGFPCQDLSLAGTQRGLEGELSRSVASLASVQGARVHLAIPKQTAFLRDDQKASASVTAPAISSCTANRSASLRS